MANNEEQFLLHRSVLHQSEMRRQTHTTRKCTQKVSGWKIIRHKVDVNHLTL